MCAFATSGSRVVPHTHLQISSYLLSFFFIAKQMNCEGRSQKFRLHTHLYIHTSAICILYSIQPLFVYSIPRIPRFLYSPRDWSRAIYLAPVGLLEGFARPPSPSARSGEDAHLSDLFRPPLFYFPFPSIFLSSFFFLDFLYFFVFLLMFTSV